MADKWHWFESIIPKRFGGLVFQNFEHFLQEMCSECSKENPEETYMKSKMKLESMENRNHDNKV